VNHTTTSGKITEPASVPRIIVSGIGTGGHYFPAIVVARALLRRNLDVVFLVRSGSMEERVARGHGLRTFSVNARPFYGVSIPMKLNFVLSLLVAVYRLHALTRHAIGLAFGGFGAVALILSCKVNRSAYYVFEPNRIPGRATRRFAASATRVFLGLPLVSELAGRVVVTGIPVRREFKERRAKSSFKKKSATTSVLFYGGSQGARRLNELALELRSSMLNRWRLTIISGQRDYERMRKMEDSRTRVLPFTERPWEEIGQADIVVSRAGALAGYEILCMGKKTIFIPFPYAIDDHQYHNAEYFSRVGDATVLQEQHLSVEMLSTRIKDLLKRKSVGTKHLIRNAEEKIVKLLLSDIRYEKT
jgi:UDP-N-acetylglucosamine--N-acetylmuramyl-(pentapeptide) pyrophosphoryl-undecaprenol N-acetylglucosamine transferase